MIPWNPLSLTCYRGGRPDSWHLVVPPLPTCQKFQEGVHRVLPNLLDGPAIGLSHLLSHCEAPLVGRVLEAPLDLWDPCRLQIPLGVQTHPSLQLHHSLCNTLLAHLP